MSAGTMTDGYLLDKLVAVAREGMTQRFWSGTGTFRGDKTPFERNQFALVCSYSVVGSP